MIPKIIPIFVIIYAYRFSDTGVLILERLGVVLTRVYEKMEEDEKKNVK